MSLFDPPLGSTIRALVPPFALGKPCEPGDRPIRTVGSALGGIEEAISGFDFGGQGVRIRHLDW